MISIYRVTGRNSRKFLTTVANIEAGKANIFHRRQPGEVYILRDATGVEVFRTH